MGRRSRSEDNRRIALERIHILFNEAEDIYQKDACLAQRCVELAREIGMRYRVRIPKEYRWMICKHCKKLMLPGHASRTRIQPRREPHVVITCLNCGGYNRIPLKEGRRSDLE